MDAIRGLINDVWTLLRSLRQTVSIADIADILIITFLIYYVLSFMRKTSASSVTKGIILVVVAAWIARAFSMIVLSYLMRQVLDLGIVVLIVLFQPELRKMFEQMGSGRISQLFKRRQSYELIENSIKSVVTASKVMSESMTGAIIVFEREVGINDFAVSGTKVDAYITPELIENIFYHNSPLHDGALIIRNGRLLAAACMLPLTTNINIGKDLGMRHRAGVGMSERSDAVIVIVSEQTGGISVAIDGMLKRHLALDTFELLLRSELIRGSRGNKGNRGKARNKAANKSAFDNKNHGERRNTAKSDQQEVDL